MEHHTPLLVTMAIGFVMAFAFGYLAHRVRMPPLVGYVLAGIVIGPFTPGFAADTEIALELAEIGVILLMFGVGLHFSTRDLIAVRGVAVPGAIGRLILGTGLGAALAVSWGWTWSSGLILGLALAVASTVVALRALEDRGAVDDANGRITIAWLVVEDLVMVLVLVLLPALAGAAGGGHELAGGAAASGSVWLLIAMTLGKIVVFLAIVALLGPRLVPWILQQTARAGSHELFTLAVLAIALGIAYGSAALFGVSFALGAFCAGVVLSNSELSHRAAEESLPLQHAFSVIFFVSVGMLFDPSILVREPLAVLLVVLVIVVGKSLISYAFIQLRGYPIGTALTVSASLAQIGEFSFILVGVATTYDLLPADGRDLVLAGALLSIMLNPLVFAAIEPVAAWMRRRRSFMARFEPGQNLRLARLQVALDANRATNAPLPPDRLVNKWPIFADLDLPMRAELLGLFKPRSAVPGERLIRAGDVADEAYFISAGEVEVAVSGRKIRLGPGDFFGEMGLLSDAPRSADVTALDYCQFLTLDREAFDGFVGKHPELQAKIGEIAGDRAAMNREPLPSPS